MGTCARCWKQFPDEKLGHIPQWRVWISPPYDKYQMTYCVDCKNEMFKE